MYQVQLFSELEEAAPEYAMELLSKQLSKEDFTQAAENYLILHAVVRMRRLRSIFELNEALNNRTKLLYASSATVVLFCFFKISYLSLLVKFSRNR
jgi:predicted nucleotidyltransferase